MSNTVWIVRRWIALDRQLRRYQDRYPEGVNLYEFAVDFSVDVKTIKRDIADFRELGQTIRAADGIEGERAYRYSYETGTIPLFTRNEK